MTEQEWDRFARWPRLAARLTLGALVLVLIMAALVPISAGHQKAPTAGIGAVIGVAPVPERARDDDLALYDRAIARIGRGEDYYSFIIAEHRLADYPVRPGVAVRLPTLAYLEAWLGPTGTGGAAVLLLAAVLVTWWRRLGAEPGGADRRALAFALLALGASLGLDRHFFVLHELWSGMLLALAFGLHRPGQWKGALAAAALALAIREHALPFVLLMAVMAAWRRDRSEALAWGGLILAFALGMAVHLQLVSAQTVPDDAASPSWLALRGLSGWLSDVVLTSNLRFLPHWLAGPLVVLATLGWCGWRSQAGAFGALFYLGYALLFMIAGRADNYYWGAMIAPALFIGLAFAPQALRALWRAAARAHPA